jgi:hypothetical protein
MPPENGEKVEIKSPAPVYDANANGSEPIML